MSKIDNFKLFVKNNPSLIKEVNSNKTTWQKLYEIYDLYGEDKEIWKEYITLDKSNNISLKSILNNVKNMNVENLEKNMSTLQKAVDFLTDITSTNKEEILPKTFTERPINKFFDD